MVRRLHCFIGTIRAQSVAIDRDGRSITISSSNAPPATFDADGRPRSEPAPGGRTMITRAEFIGEQLSVSTTGNRATDFVVTFEPVDNGGGLIVTRQLDSDDLQEPVTVESYYRRVAREPQWDLNAPDSAMGDGPDCGHLRCRSTPDWSPC